ncbi:MAG: Rieske (2Fe-2S) protein [Proteobacteria bacterium]|nr:Rieske (2Fe-2S) protein [Pseudomonadota bacterium]
MEDHLQDGRDPAVSEAAAPTGQAPAGQAGAGRVLCRLDDIEDGQGKGFTLGQGPEAREIFVVREGARVFGYVNSCPHLGTPLDWQSDRFILDDSGLIMCATHGALFEIADGFCVDGPCVGKNLEPVPVVIDADGRVRLVED